MNKKLNHHTESIRSKLLLVFFVTNIILGILVSSNLMLTNHFLKEIGKTYKESVKLHTFLNTLEETNKAYKDFLQSKSDTSLANYYNSFPYLNEQTKNFNRQIIWNDSALLEKNIANLTDSYIEATHKAIQGKRARDIDMQREGLTQSETLYQYIAARVEILSQSKLKSDYNYYLKANVQVETLQSISVAAFIFIFLSNAVFFALLVHKITTPLKILAISSEKISGGNYNIPPLNIDTDDEISVLANAFNKMVQNIQLKMQQIKEKNLKEIEYKKREYEMENHLKTAQLKSLQEQVNPHFLFNCLNTAAQLSMIEGADKVCRFIEDVADFYRYNLKLIETDTLLSSEIEFIETYVDIMRVRFGDDVFTFSKDIDESVLNCRVPSLILQPIVENCFNHGIREMEVGGKICLTVRKQNNRVHICIRDNGCGFSEEFLNNYSQDISEHLHSGSNRKSIGMANVSRRIALYYKRDDCFFIGNCQNNSGAEVSIFIPLNNSGGHEWKNC